MRSLEEQCIGAQVRMLSNLLSRQAVCNMDRLGEARLTRMQAMIIWYLLSAEGQERCFQRDIESRFRLRRSTATGILQLMEQHGLIEREPVRHDARLKRLVPTGRAHALHEQICRDMERQEALMCEGVGEAELETWFAVSRRICANLEARQNKTPEETV